jgi:intracellular septation protein
MPSALSLWWSPLWRITLAIVVLSYAIEWPARLVFSLDEMFIKWRASIFWFALAAIFWIVGAASIRFFTSVLRGERLRLSPAQWLVVARGLALFFFAIALLNLLVAYTTSTDTWVNFKLFVPYPLLIVFLGVVAAHLRRSRDAA